MNSGCRGTVAAGLVTRARVGDCSLPGEGEEVGLLVLAALEVLVVLVAPLFKTRLTAMYAHDSFLTVHARQAGRPSSHLTLRDLQLRHPVLVLRCGRLAW